MTIAFIIAATLLLIVGTGAWYRLGEWHKAWVKQQNYIESQKNRVAKLERKITHVEGERDHAIAERKHYAESWFEMNQLYREQGQELRKLKGEPATPSSLLYEYDTFFTPAPLTVRADDPTALANALLARQEEDLTAAKGAWTRLQRRMERALSLDTNGTGPLFSQAKPKVAAKALEVVVAEWSKDQDVTADRNTVAAYLVADPAGVKKLAA